MRIKKLLALILAMSLLVTSLPVTAFANVAGMGSGSGTAGGVGTPAGTDLRSIVTDELFLNKTATLMGDGTYKINLEAYATDALITKTVKLGIPLDVVLVVDQSGSLKNSGSVDFMKNSIRDFMNALKANGEAVGVDHRVSICSFAGDDLAVLSGPADEKYGYSFAGDLWDLAWLNTGLYVDGKFQDYGTVEYTRIDSLDNLDTTRYYLVKYTSTLENGSSVAEYFRIYYYENYGSWYIHNGKEGLVGLATRKKDGADKTTSEELITKYEVYDVGESTLQLDQADYAASWEYIADGQGNLNADVAAAINSLASNGGTRTSYGLKMARNMLKYITPGTDNDIRKKMVVVFTDGKAGAGWNSDGEMAATLAEANKIKASGVDIYTVGVYSDSVATDIASFMNQFSSNCGVIEFSENPTTEYEYNNLGQNTWVSSVTGRYRTLPSFYKVKNEDGTEEFYPVRVRVETRYTDAAKDWVVTPPYKWTYITDTGEMPIPTELLNQDGTAITGLYKIGSGDYNSDLGYSQTSDSFDNLSSLFQTVLDKETILSSEVMLDATAILKDVLADGFTLTDNTQITVSVVPGSVSKENSNLSPDELNSDKITWGEAQQVLTMNAREKTAASEPFVVTGAFDQTEMTLTATAENGEINVTGYNYAAQFISKDHVGSKLVVTITGVEAVTGVTTNAATSTNKATSGVYEGPESDADKDGIPGEIKTPFPVPNTYLTSEYYYLDETGKVTFEIKDFLMDEGINISDGYHFFNTAEPGTALETDYGTVTVNGDGTVTYQLKEGVELEKDIICLFGKTEDITVKAASANANGNMWSEITILPPLAAGKLHTDKSATLMGDGTYTIDLEAFATGTPAITALSTGVPLDVVLVIDQSGSLYNVDHIYNAKGEVIGIDYYDDKPLAALKAAVSSFVHELQDNADANGLNHRISICGFAGDEYSGWSRGREWLEKCNQPEEGYAEGCYSYAGDVEDIFFTNTGLFVNGEFKKYGAANYSNKLDLSPYDQLTDEDLAKVLDNTLYIANKKGTQRYVQLYYRTGHSAFSVWTGNTHSSIFNEDLTEEEKNAIYAEYGKGTAAAKEAQYKAEKKLNMEKLLKDYDLYEWTTEVNVQLTADDYKNSWENISVNGNVNPDIAKAIDALAGNGATFLSYGMKMARHMLENAPATDDDVERKKVVIVFTDGNPGGTLALGKAEEDAALAEAKKIKDGLFDKNSNAINAEIYTVGIYEGETEGDNDFMNQLSSNCKSHTFSGPETHTLDTSASHFTATYYWFLTPDCFYQLVKANGDKEYCPIKVYWSSETGYEWYYVTDDGLKAIPAGMVSSDAPKTITGVYTLKSGEYNPDLGYYSNSDNFSDLPDLFSEIVTEVSTYSSEVQLDAKAILKDVMADGFTLTNNTQITVSVVPGSVKEEFADVGANRLGSEHISWDAPQEVLIFKYSEAKEGTGNVIVNGAADQTEMTITATASEDGIITVTGFNYAAALDNHKENAQYICAGHPGSKLVVTITGVEADTSVPTNVNIATNKGTSGIYEGLESDLDGDDTKGEIQATFPIPTTHIISKVYVMDYAQTLTIDPKDFLMDKVMTSLDVDGYNYFDSAVTAVTQTYGKVAVSDGKITYTPTKTNWGSYDTFYIFGATTDATIKGATANANGNVWAKISVIPANNVYYEDTFVTSEEDGVTGIVFSGSWVEVDANGDSAVGGNQGENAESGENAEGDNQGGVHGWEDNLADDNNFSDGSAHLSNTPGATATFTFTGTGVDIYSRTNFETGVILAMLYEGTSTTGEDVKNLRAKYSIMVDNLAASGDYFQVPTLSLCQIPQKDPVTGESVMADLPHGTYTVKIIVFQANSSQTDSERFLYYLDGIRVYNPIQDQEGDSTVSGAYGDKELNASFVEIRDKLLDANSFSAEDAESAGPVFIDRIPNKEATDEDEKFDDNTQTFEIGTYEELGPKNEVYLAASKFHGIAFAVEYQEGAHYYIGMKSLTGKPVTVMADITNAGDMDIFDIRHSTDMYYEVFPTWEYDEDGNPTIGIISVLVSPSLDENGESIEDTILSLTKLKVTGPAATTLKFARVPNAKLLAMVREAVNAKPETEDTTPDVPSVDVENPGSDTTQDKQTQQNLMLELLTKIFDDLRGWFES